MVQRVVRPAQETDSLACRPRRSLARRTLLGMGLVAVLPTLVSVLVFQQMFKDYQADSHVHESEILATIVAHSVTGQLDQVWTRQQGETLNRLSSELNIAFICVLNRYGRPLYLGVYDQAAWDEYLEIHGPTFTRYDVIPSTNSLVHLPSQAVLKIAPVRRPVYDRRITDRPGEIEGAVLLATKPRPISTVMWTIFRVQFAVVLVVCLIALPVMALLLRRWARPMRGLIEQTRRLAIGLPPEPVKITRDDEFGYLSRAFNDMARKLFAQHRKLVDTNESLEQRVKQRTAELQQAVAKFDAIAKTDPLTNLANRRALHQAMDVRFNQSRVNGSDLAVAIIDLDGFKSVNDTYGHDRGDELLLAAADLIRKHTRGGDMAARMGGDEFIIMMPGTTAAAAAEIADQIRQGFEITCSNLFRETDPPMRVTMSIGVASFCQSRPDSTDALITHADQALYAAKSAGKSCVRVNHSTSSPKEPSHEAA